MGIVGDNPWGKAAETRIWPLTCIYLWGQERWSYTSIPPHVGTTLQLPYFITWGRWILASAPYATIAVRSYPSGMGTGCTCSDVHLSLFQPLCSALLMYCIATTGAPRKSDLQANYLLNAVMKWAALVLCIRDDPGSNLCSEIGCHDKGFSWFSSVSPGSAAIVPKVGHGSFLPHTFQFTTRYLTYHIIWTTYSVFT
jgi:hypothetical protein